MDFSKIYQLKGLEPKKQRSHELLWMLWFDGGKICNISKYLEAPGWGLRSAMKGWTKHKTVVTHPNMGCGFPFLSNDSSGL